jgi:hypothetical protein
MTPRRWLLALLLLLVPTAFAQSNDDLMFVPSPLIATAEEPYTLGLRISPSRNDGDAVVDWKLPVGALQWIDPRCVDRGDRTYRCTIPGGTTAIVRANLISPIGTFFETSAIFVSPAPITPFPKSAELKMRAPVKTPKITMPDEESWSNGNTTVRFELDATVPPERATSLIVFLRVPQVVSFTAPEGWTCGGGGEQIQCTTPSATIHQSMTVEANRGTSVDIRVSATIAWQDRHYGNDETRASATARAFSHRVPVTSDADSGAGSLREAMIAAAQITEQGSRTRITFAPEVHTIHLRTPLPPLAGLDVWLDGTAGRSATQKVAIDATALTNGPAIAVNAHITGGVRGLAVHSAPGNGIECHSNCIIADNYIGLDADGMTPRPNWSRGVWAGDVQASIERNVISGNYRSAIFVDSSASGSATGNLIGVAADGITPIGNGASGIFVGPQTRYPAGDGSAFSVTDNLIAYSRDFGIAIANPQWRVTAVNNRFIDNRISDIDAGLDGRQSPDVRITKAVYDAATDTTWVYGTVENPGFTTTIAIYSLAASHGSMSLSNEKTFVFRAAGNLTGRAITANRVIDGGFADYPWWMSTEMSEPFTFQ